jgi:tetratricopeptide (TPR) repeat protein
MYTKNSIIICFLCFLTYTSLFSQEQKVIDRLTTDVETKTDSLKRTWKNSKEPDSLRFKAIRSYYKMYAYAKPDSTILLTDYHYALAKEKDVTKEMFWALNQKGIVYGHKGDLDESQDFYLQALILAKQLKNPVLWALVEGNLGIIYAKQNNYQKATQSFSTALKIFQKEKNDFAVIRETMKNDFEVKLYEAKLENSK